MPQTTCHNKPTRYESSIQRASLRCAGTSDNKFRGWRHFKDVSETEIIDPSSWISQRPFDRLIVYDYWLWADTTSILVNKANRRTEFQFYWYYDSTHFGQPFRSSSGVLSRTSALVRFIQFWWPFATRSRMKLRSILLLVANGHHNCIKRTKADVRLRTADDGRKGCPKHVES